MSDTTGAFTNPTVIGSEGGDTVTPTAGDGDGPDTDTTLPVFPVPDGVVLPDMVITIALQSDEARNAVTAARSADGRLLLVPRVEGRFGDYGVTGRIEDDAHLPDGTEAITVRSGPRARIGAGTVGTDSALWVSSETIDEDAATTATGDELDQAAETYRAVMSSLLERVGGRRMVGALRDLHSPSAVADSIGQWPDLSLQRRVELLETVDVGRRLELATEWAKELLAELDVREKIQNEVGEGLEKGQREMLLRRQMEAIRAELGEGDGDVVADYRAQLEAAELPEAAATAVGKEIDRLERTGTESTESNWIRTWLDTVFEIPWGTVDEEHTDLGEARSVLDADHTGLDEVKDRLVEHLAVRKLRNERGVSDPSRGRRRGVVLALVGPPGVGKTSLGESVARSLGRRFVRLALGGTRDEAEIRGHRRTYVGARPGKLVRALTEAGSMNPVVLLDEVDKLGADFRGDPSAALLEVLDPAQNHSFRDSYLEFELDLSDVVFVATANVIDTIPAPLLDRLEIITLDGYTETEKATIARDHLLPTLTERNGLADGEVEVPDETLAAITAEWTREAGVRGLERLLDKVLRKAAARVSSGEADLPIRIEAADLRAQLGRPAARDDDVIGRIDRPGIANGLAVTGAGGDALTVETALVAGDGEPILTGQLGDVMSESASIARSVASAQTADVGGFPAGQRLHVHFPSGAVPKDGPSAGTAITTALVSLLTGRRVRPEVAMTGEISLGGRVLPVGGIKQKVLAAHRAGIGDVIIPATNADDLDEVADEVREAVRIHPVERIEAVLDLALEPAQVDQAPAAA